MILGRKDPQTYGVDNDVAYIDLRNREGLVVARSQNGHKFHARISIDYKSVFVGSYDTAEEAARARDIKAKELHGEFAVLNFA